MGIVRLTATVGGGGGAAARVTNADILTVTVEGGGWGTKGDKWGQLN